VNCVDRNAPERDSEQDFLPGLEGGQSAPPHPRRSSRRETRTRTPQSPLDDRGLRQHR
jgi:hypothetical protein